MPCHGLGRRSAGMAGFLRARPVMDDTFVLTERFRPIKLGLTAVPGQGWL